MVVVVHKMIVAADDGGGGGGSFTGGAVACVDVCVPVVALIVFLAASCGGW